MNIFTAAVFGMLFLTANLYSQTIQTLTLNEAVQKVLTASPQVKEAEHSIAGAEARVNISGSSDYPSADFEASYARVAPVSTASFGPEEFQLNPANNYDGHVNVNALLYDFDKRKTTTDVSRSAVASTRDRLALIKESLSYQTAKMFYTILFIQKNIAVHNQEIATLNEHLVMTKKKVESGTATDFDILTIQVRIAASQNKGIDLANALKQAEIRLKETAHIPADDSLQLVGSFDSTVVQSEDESFVQQALGSRLELHGADDAISTALLQKNLVSLNDYPSLRFHFAYGLKNGIFPNMNVLRGNYVAALQLSVPLFNGFRTEYQKDEAEATVNAAQERKNFVTQQIRTEVRQAVSDVQSNQEKVRVAQFTIEQAQKALEIARIRYDAGTVTNLDLLDAETSLIDAQFQKVQAMYHVMLSKFELDEAIGKDI